MNPHRKNRRAGREWPRAQIESTNNESGGGSDFFRRSNDRRADRKARQLCRQVLRTLNVALAGCGDEILQDLTVLAVEPAPDAGRLLATVAPGFTARRAGFAGILERLDRAGGRLRSEVAEAIVRKRAPELAFTVLLTPGEVTP